MGRLIKPVCALTVAVLFLGACASDPAEPRGPQNSEDAAAPESSPTSDDNASELSGGIPEAARNLATRPSSIKGGKSTVRPGLTTKEPTQAEYKKLAAKLPPMPKVPSIENARPNPRLLAKGDRGGGAAEFYANTVGYEGVTHTFFQFTNDLGVNSGNNCGQAAAATLLTFWRAYPYPDSNDPGYRLRALEYAYPPDTLWGVFGTSPSRMISMLDRESSLALWYLSGESNLKYYVGRGYPVIVLLDVQPMDGRWGGHWVMVYGYNATHVFITNYQDESFNAVTWDEFRKGWGGNVPTWAGMKNKGLMFY